MKDLYVLYLTLNCNLDCSYCYLQEKEDVNPSLDVIKQRITLLESKIKASKELNIEFLGGEPLLNEEGLSFALSYLKAINPNASFSIVTNGTIYNDNIVNLLNEYQVDLRISWDGIAFAHNACRVFKQSHKGTFEIVTQNIQRYLKALNKKPCIAITLNRYNIPYLYQSLKYLYQIGALIVNIGIVFQDINETSKVMLQKQVEKFYQDTELYYHMIVPALTKIDYELYDETYETSEIGLKQNKIPMSLTDEEKNKNKKYFFFDEIRRSALKK